MLKKLRIKIVCVTMLIVVAMLCVIFGLVSHFTAANLEREAMGTLQAALDDGTPHHHRFDLYGNDFDKPGTSDIETPRETTENADAAEEPGTALSGDSPISDSSDNEGPPPFDTEIEPRDGFQGIMELPYLIAEVGEDGTVRSIVGNYASLPIGDIDPADLVNAALAERRSGGVLEEYGTYFLKRSAPDGTRIAFTDATAGEETLRDLTRTCLLIGIASLLVFFLISLLFARWAVKPVERAWQQQTQFVSDASHELKTPLTVVLTNAELLQNEVGTDGKPAAYAANILNVSRQMRELVNRLLVLARADNGAAKTVFLPLDLSELMEESLLPFEPLFYEKGLQLESAIAPGICVEGDEAQLRQLADILLDNARKYCLPAGSVRVRLERSPRGKASLTVENDGQDMSQEELGRIFERFYRADAARTAGEGFGLGLSIAANIVRDHGGRIWAESAAGTFSLHVELPQNESRGRSI